MVHTNTACHELAHAQDLRKRLVCALEAVESTLPNDVHLALLLGIAQVGRRECHGILLTALLGEDKVDHGQQASLAEVRDEVRPDVLVELEPASSATSTSAKPSATSTRRNRGRRRALAAAAVRVVASAADAGERRGAASREVLGLDGRATTATRALNGRQARGLALLVLLATQRLAGRLVAVADKLSLRVDNLVQLLAGPEVVLEGNGTHGGRDDVNVLLLGAANPVGELASVGHGGGEKDNVDVLGQHDNDLLPHNTTLGIVHVVHLVKNDKLDIADEVRSLVEHATQNLGGHLEKRSANALDFHLQSDSCPRG